MSSDLEKTGTVTAALRNLLGNGEKLTASWSLSDSASALYAGSFLKPRAFGTSKTLSVSGFKEKHDFSERSSAKCEATGVRVGVRDLQGTVRRQAREGKRRLSRSRAVRGASERVSGRGGERGK